VSISAVKLMNKMGVIINNELMKRRFILLFSRVILLEIQ